MKQKRKFKIFLAMLFCISCIVLPSVKIRAEGRIFIDTNKKYEGMKTSFAKGYMPVIKKNKMYLVVPFLAEGSFEADSLFVGVSFEREENSPFYFKNYQKKVKKAKNGVFLYRAKIKLKKERVDGAYPLHLNVWAGTGEESIQQEFTIYVEITDGKVMRNEMGYETKEGMAGEKQELPAAESKEEAVHQPRILLEGNSLQGTFLQAGSSTPWSLSAKNCSSSQPIENIKVTLLSDRKDVLFEKNSWYFGRVEAGKEMDLSQNITVEKKASAEAVQVELAFDYEDKKGNAYHSSETLSLSVRQIQQAKLVNLFVPESIYESETDFVTFQIQNTGLAVLYNAKVRLEGKGLFADELFLGNVEAGTSEDGEISVFAGTLNMDDSGEISKEDTKRYGEVSGEIIFSYENEQGEVTEWRQTVSTAIKKPQIVELRIEEEEPQTNQWWITIVILVIIVLLLIIVWLSIRVKYYQRMRREIYGRT